MRESTRLPDILGKTYGELTLLEVVSNPYGFKGAKKTPKEADGNTTFGVFKCSCGKKKIVNVKTIIYADKDSRSLTCSHKIRKGRAYYHSDEKLLARFIMNFTKINKEGCEWESLSKFYDDMFLQYLTVYYDIPEKFNSISIRYAKYDASLPWSKENMFFYNGFRLDKFISEKVFDDIVVNGKEFRNLYELAVAYDMDLSTIYKRYDRGIRGDSLVSKGRVYLTDYLKKD